MYFTNMYRLDDEVKFLGCDREFRLEIQTASFRKHDEIAMVIY